MGCNRVIISSAITQAGSTTVTWLPFASVPGLIGFDAVLSQGGTATVKEVRDPKSTTATINVAAQTGANLQIYPVDGKGRLEGSASFKTPIPFPETPYPNPNQRPVILSACSDGATVTVNWLPSVIDLLAGYCITITKNGAELENFISEGANINVATVNYACVDGNEYRIVVTACDPGGPTSNVSYDAPIPYPAG